MFTNNENTRILVPNAVSKQVKENMLNNEAPDSSEDPDKPGTSGEVAACRVCLAVDGRLVAISSGMEDKLATLTGVALSEEKGLPRHLCVFCVAKLSKCAGFRDSCRRSTALLQTLLEKGPLKMNDIKAINRNSHKLTNGLAWHKVFEFGTDPLLTVPLIKTESEESSHEITGCIEVEYMGREDSTKSDVGSHTFEVPLQKHEITEIKLVKLKTESSNAHSDDDFDDRDTKVKNYASDTDSDTSDETIASLKRGKRKRIKLETEAAKYTKKYKNVKSKDDSSDKAGASKKKRRKKIVKSTDASARKSFKKQNTEEKEPERKKFAYNCASCGKGFKKETTLFSHKPCYDPNTSAERIATIKKDTDVDFEKKYNFTIKLLSKEEQRQRIEEKRRNRSEFSCDVCGKDYVKESTLMAHKTFYHEPSLPFECDVCRYRFRSRASLRKHQLDDRHRAVFTCNECGKVSRNRTYAKEHYLMHKGTTYTCPYCQIVYERQSSYYGHIRLQHPSENEACDECGETFTGKVGLLVHKRMRHRTNDTPSVDTKCKVCEVAFMNAEALQRHTELSAGFGHAALWPCTSCGDSCGSEAGLAAHAQDKHPPDQHYCKECDKTFSNASSFELHVDRKHKNRRAATVRIRHGRIVCEICGKVFMCLTTLQYHMNVHLGLKPYQCPHCPKAFAQKTNLRLHMRVHTGERPYKCEQCPQAFAAQGNLIRHMKNVHLRVQVKCDTCGKMMGADSLSLHVRTVHLNQPYVRRKRSQTKKSQVLVNEGGV